MKALVLAAGFGTRLAPYTELVPKPLFTVAGMTVLERMIACLKRAGCSEIAVNAHHLAHRVRSFVMENDFGLPVHLKYESEILGTGGAIRNLSDFWDETPFIVVNADIVTDIDLADSYRTHRSCNAPVSLVMHDHPRFNQVWVDENNRIAGFERYPDPISVPGKRKLAFTGIHIMDPSVLSWIPDFGFSDIIAVYRQMIKEGIPIQATIVAGHYWQDMGTPARFRKAVIDTMAPEVFRSVFPDDDTIYLKSRHLSGDGSDRNWFRLTCGQRRLIVADHGITLEFPGSELNAFLNIGQHLYDRGLPVPRIYAHDTFSGLVFLEDLGDCHLQQIVSDSQDSQSTETLYRSVIETLFDLTGRALDSFDPSWTCQSRSYDEALILEKECRYFVDAFVNGFLNMDISYDDLSDEFTCLARSTLERGINGLIHRDFQSRNIMIKDGIPHLIDFQGARFGPVQYDLASLLIDPYVGLDPFLQKRLLAYATEKAVRRFSCDPVRFVQGFNDCCITRNLQMLGAFGFLSRVKKKQSFEQWIPAATAMLPVHIHRAEPHAFPKLAAIAEKILSIQKQNGVIFYRSSPKGE